uniref:Uncharacterized protein n=1 Tax=viral metagenome TaxID=1070528 RepID=A0A6M3M3A9_9ZZZZ
MILKANIDGWGGYQYFECPKSIRTSILYPGKEEAERQMLVKEHIKKTSVDSEVWDFTDRVPFGQEVDKGVTEFWLCDGIKPVAVFAYSPNYILNNEGKTVERI